MLALIAEDDTVYARTVQKVLQNDQLSSMICHSGLATMNLVARNHFDLILLSATLKGLRGINDLRMRHNSSADVPILLLGSGNNYPKIISGMAEGADDFCLRSDDLQQLRARVVARLRRKNAAAESMLHYEDLSMQIENFQVWRAGVPIHLTRTQFSLLECLVRARGRVLTGTQLMDTVWPEKAVSRNNVEVFIRQLRKSIDSRFSTRLIYNVRGIGYCLRAH